MFLRDSPHFPGYIVEGFIPAGFAENLFTPFLSPYQGSFKAVLIIIHARSAGSAGTESAVAMLVLIISDDFPDLTFFVFIDPSSTFPETDFANGGCTAGIHAEFSSFGRGGG